jgi:leader peptidase (prepilin peptidase)/N-methyltransferase
MTTVILFVFGAIIGSFLNVFALRYNSGLSLGGRSACGSCGRQLAWFELVPVLSYLSLRGRCRSCRGRIPAQYPLVELWTALLFATLPLVFMPVFCLYVAITVYDSRHKIIPDGLAYASVALALPAALLMGDRGLLDWLAGPILFAFFGLFWLASKGRVMGLGDAKLALSIGLLLGAAQGFSAAVCAFWLGAAYGLALLVIKGSDTTIKRRSRLTMKSEIPFAPFLVFGSWAAAAFHLDLFHVSTILELFS